MQFHAIFTQYGLFQSFLGQFQHVAYQKACTRAEKSISDTFTQFHTRLHAISHNFTQISRNFLHYLGYFSHFWANFNMLGIKKHVLESRNSLVILSSNFTQFSRNFGYFSHFWANFNMLGIKKHVLEPRNSLVILSKNFTRV